MRRIPSDGAFRTPQSFTLLTADQLLSKLRWDLAQLEQLRWNEDLGVHWRQVVSYKAVECATSIWHLAEWFAADIRGEQPRERLRAFLKLDVRDPGRAISSNELRSAAVKRCPDLEICRVVAVATKHYEVGRSPRPDIRTEAYRSLAYREGEPFQQPVMWLAVLVGGIKRDMREVFHNCLHFWEELSHVARPGSSWQPGEMIPESAHSVQEPPAYPTAKRGWSSRLRGLQNKLARLLTLS